MAALAAAVLLVFWALRPSRTPPEPTPASELAQVPARPAFTAPQAKPSASVSPINFVDGVPVYPAGSAQVDGEGMLPHPHTPTHERIFHENNLIGSLDGAMDVKDVAGMRKLLRQYRDEYPEDSHELQTGYELVADCLEQLTSERRARAQRYYDTELASGLRRYIRRHCLEPELP
jgi:hypothetical protein